MSWQVTWQERARTAWARRERLSAWQSYKLGDEPTAWRTFYGNAPGECWAKAQRWRAMRDRELIQAEAQRVYDESLARGRVAP